MCANEYGTMSAKHQTKDKAIVKKYERLGSQV